MKPLHAVDPSRLYGAPPTRVLSRSSTTSRASNTDTDNAVLSPTTTSASHKALPQGPVGVSGGINLPVWQRLPSRNLSFGSAEILTVAECFRHASLFCDKSVRITGKLLHRHVHLSDGMVSLVLGDPLVPTKSLAGRRRSSLGSAKNAILRRVSFPKTPSAAATTGLGQSALKKRTPGTILRRISGAGLLPLQSVGDYAAVTPGGLGTSSRKRPLSFTTPSLATTDALVQALQSPNCIWVLADPAHVSVNHCTVDDLAMALGELCVYTGVGNEDANGAGATAGNMPASVRAVADAVQAAVCAASNKEATRPIYYLQTRILRNANGTNMKLHADALYARRQQLLTLQQHCPLTTMTDDQNVPLDPSLQVRQGCGPPPYTILDERNNSN